MFNLEQFAFKHKKLKKNRHEKLRCMMESRILQQVRISSGSAPLLSIQSVLSL